MADQGERRVVLLNEDDVLLRNFIRHALESTDFEVLSAANAEEALALSRAFEGPIHALVADFDTYRLDNSRAAMVTIRQERPETAAIIVSGIHNADEFAELKAVFVAKPFLINGLIDALERTISKPC
jgi:DNA-binding NtrC family response regulator